MTVTQTTQSPNMTGHTQTGNAAKNFEEKQQRLAEGSKQPVMLSGAEMLVQSLTDEGVKYIFGYQAAQCCTFMTRCFSKKTSNIF